MIFKYLYRPCEGYFVVFERVIYFIPPQSPSQIHSLLSSVASEVSNMTSPPQNLPYSCRSIRSRGERVAAYVHSTASYSLFHGITCYRRETSVRLYPQLIPLERRRVLQPRLGTSFVT